jgi:hypothetical protein
MRTVQDPRGVTWICLELPQIPAGLATDGAMGADPVAIECNSGAERAVVLVPPDWEDAMDDSTLVRQISRVLGG